MKYYLNNAATSFPKAPGVPEAVADCLRRLPGSANRGGFNDFDVFAQVRAALASLLGIRNQDRIALCSNATHALNLAIFGFPFVPGDVVVTTSAEHNSVLRPLYQLEKSRQIRTVFVPTDDTGRIDIIEWRRAIEFNHPRLVVFTHASNVTGAVNDALTLTGAAKEHGAKVLLDASQTIGIVDVKPELWGVDLAAFTGHKYLLGPQGTGGLYAAEGLDLSPHMVGGTGIFSDDDEMPKEMPLHLEAGTPNEPSFAGLYEALCWQQANPVQGGEIEKLRTYLISELILAGASVISPKGLCTPVVSFTISGHSSGEVGDILTDSYDILCRSGLHCAPKIHAFLKYNEGGTVRISLSRFTLKKEADEVTAAVRDIVHGPL